MGPLTPIIGLRLLALAAGLRHNAEIGQPGLCFSAYGHKFGINHLGPKRAASSRSGPTMRAEARPRLATSTPAELASRATAGRRSSVREARADLRDRARGRDDHGPCRGIRCRATGGVAHSLRNCSDRPARWLTIHAPDGGFAAFMRGVRDGVKVEWDKGRERAIGALLNGIPPVDQFSA
jgi:hypothetical protein